MTQDRNSLDAGSSRPMSETIPEDLMQAAWEIAAEYERNPYTLGGASVIARALMAQRTRQEERVRVLEEALRLVKSMRTVESLAPPVHEFERAKRSEAWAKIDEEIRAALGNGGGDA